MSETMEDIENLVSEITDVFRTMPPEDAEALKTEWIAELTNIGLSSRSVKFLEKLADTTINHTQ